MDNVDCIIGAGTGGLASHGAGQPRSNGCAIGMNIHDLTLSRYG
jgi:hypothetical protein